MTRYSLKDMDTPLREAVAVAGGAKALARKLGLKGGRLNWRTTPQHWLFEVSKLTGVSPETLRPDLEEWIFAEKSKRRMAAAREKFGLVRLAMPTATLQARSDQGTLDTLIALAACRMTAEETGIGMAQIFVGREREHMWARTRAMGLALVAGRASATTIGHVFGVSRQAVDNAGERWIRARDGDHPEDYLDPVEHGPGRVMERGRVRPAKVGDEALRAAEARFKAKIEGEAA